MRQVPVFNTAKPKPGTFDSDLFCFVRSMRARRVVVCARRSARMLQMQRGLFSDGPNRFGVRRVPSGVRPRCTRTQTSDVHALSGVYRIAAARTHACMYMNVRARVCVRMLAC